MKILWFTDHPRSVSDVEVQRTAGAQIDLEWGVTDALEVEKVNGENEEISYQWSQMEEEIGTRVEDER
jgi:hypothetical protein